MPSLFVKDAPAIFRLLKGVLCVYKPSGVTEGAVRYAILTKLCKELNEMDCRPPIDHVTIEGDTTKEMRVAVRPSFADHPLVVGPRYQEKDIKCNWMLDLGVRTSGVFVLGLDDSGVRKIEALDHSHQLRTFHVSGRFGTATDTFFTDGRVVERSRFKHVRREWLDKYLASVQAAHQRAVFEISGLDIQSQDAYELAVQGLMRPSDPHIPMIYGIKCIELNLPEFTIEVHSTNENEIYLMSLINEIGIKLRTNAVCTGLRCVRHSYFTVHNALLRKHWTLEHVINNLQENQKILKANPNFYSPLIKEAKLQEPKNQSIVC